MFCFFNKKEASPLPNADFALAFSSAAQIRQMA